MNRPLPLDERHVPVSESAAKTHREFIKTQLVEISLAVAQAPMFAWSVLWNPLGVSVRHHPDAKHWLFNFDPEYEVTPLTIETDYHMLTVVKARLAADGVAVPK